MILAARTAVRNCGLVPLFCGPSFYPSHAAAYGQWIGIYSGRTKTLPSVLDSPGDLPL
jgi:hypothetical protein